MEDFSKKLKAIMVYMDISQQELAEVLGTTQSNISFKFKTNNFKITDIEKIAKKYNLGFEINFTLPNGEKF